MEQYSYVYIMSSKRRGTIYIGLTSDLPKRAYEHKNDLVEGFTKKYGCHTLVYLEPIEDFDSALKREKQMKAWNRQWKIELIEKTNPAWKDLSDNLI